MKERNRVRIFSILLLGVIILLFILYRKKNEEVVADARLSDKAEELELPGGESSEENNTTLKENNQKDEVVGEEEKQQDENKLEAYFGTYKIIEYCPTIYVKADWISDQEGDMMVGRTIILEKDFLFTCDSERRRGTREGRYGFGGNHIITEYMIDNPDYSFEERQPEKMKASEAEMEIWFPDYYEKINGRIDVSLKKDFGQEYYTLKEENKIIMSSVHNQYFLLEKIEDIPLEDLVEREIGEKEKEEILQSIYGSYVVTAFLPTKFYPDLDVNGEELLPKEEAELMLGKTISLFENSCTIYDNYRRPNSEIMERAENDSWLKEIEITEPDYQVAVRMRNKIYGLRDDMLPEEMEQEEYIEISVYPGYRCGGDNALPQFYQLADGQLLMLAMEQYFLLEKNQN
ncbi:MAG: hypothetical protein MR922_12170 [Lachnospiraceae bacterium]|nr:hypothetical protein [Lachnospiraceae bacterium]